MRLTNHRSQLFIILIVCLLALTLVASALAKPNTLNRAEIPDKYKWDLSDIYPNWEAWEADLGRLEKLMDSYAALQGTLNQGAAQILKANKLGDELGMLTYKVYRYPALSSVTDTRNNEIAAKLQRVQILFAKFNIATAWYNPELLTIPWKTMKGWLDNTPELAPYRYGIEDLYRRQAHVLDKDKEQLLSYFSQVNGAPGSIYRELSTSDIKYATTTLSDGEEKTITPGEYYKILSTDRNQDDRAKAFESFYGVFAANANTYAAIYNGILQRDWASTQARNYKSCLEAALDDDNVPVSVYENLVTQVKAGLGPVHRYNALRKKALKLENYHGYDGSLPIVNFDKTYKYEDVKPWVIESVAPLGKEYQKKMKKVLSSRWIDVYENEGKRSGAFSAGVYGVHPYMLMNYNETLENVFTLAHEAGHTMHTLLADENQPFATSDYKIFVAEVASTLNEALFLDYLMEHTDDPVERVALLQQAIDNIIGTFYVQVMFAEYEWRAHQMVEQGQPITADALSALYTELKNEHDGDAVIFDELYGATWTRISHFYNSPFYVYQYATCYASSAKIHKAITTGSKKERKAAVEKYLTLLKSGGSDYPMELLKKAGVDLTQPETIQAVVDQLDDLVTKLEKEMARL